MLQNELRKQIVKILEQHENSNLASAAARELIAEEISNTVSKTKIHYVDVSDMSSKDALEFIKNYRKGISNEKQVY